MNHNISPDRKLRYLGIYMNEWVDSYPKPIKPFERWLESTLDKKHNKGKHEATKKFKNICRYCKRGFDHYVEKTQDHVVPVSRGGYNKKENRVPCCYDCNQFKKDKTPKDWLDELKILAKKPNKIRPPYDIHAIGRMIHNLKKVIEEAKDNNNKVSEYKI